MIDVSRLWVTDWIVCGFFAYLIVLAAVFPLSARHRGRVLLVGLVCVATAVMLAQLRLSPILQTARAWLPVVYLLEGYWLCGLFFRRPMPEAEARLLAFDRWLFGVAKLDRLLSRGPRVVLEYFEFAYVLAFPFVPLSFGLFWGLGSRADADSFWTAVLLAGFVCYGMLPWIQTRPPRSVETGSRLDRRGLLLRRVNLFVLNGVSVQANTFPSGHASTAVAAALAVVEVDGATGAACLFFALSIVVATVVGRYHYAMDSVLGGLIGVATWWVGFRLVASLT